MVDYYAFDNTQDNLVGMKGKLIQCALVLHLE